MQPAWTFCSYRCALYLRSGIHLRKNVCVTDEIELNRTVDTVCTELPQLGALRCSVLRLGVHELRLFETSVCVFETSVCVSLSLVLNVLCFAFICRQSCVS